MAKHENIARGNARVGVQIGSDSDREPRLVSTRSEGPNVTINTYDNGFVERVEYIERGSSHPAGPGFTRTVSGR